MCKKKLVSVKPSKAKHKKLTATFYCPIRKKYTKVHFGDRRYNDFTTYNKKYGAKVANERKKLYLQRHRNDNYGDVTSPGSLAKHILWNKKTVKNSINDYKRRYRK